jgi:hypothetical protein
MRRSLLILLAIGLASAAIVRLTSAIARHLCAQQLVPPGDDLAWFRREFRLSDSELARIRQLHEGYLPRCRDMCERIAARKQDLQAALAAGNSVTPEAEQKLAEVGALRAQCQAQMLRHFHEVSQAMPPEQGRRYLTEMQRLTLGFHEQFEDTMSGNEAGPHGHR